MGNCIEFFVGVNSWDSDALVGLVSSRDVSDKGRRRRKAIRLMRKTRRFSSFGILWTRKLIIVTSGWDSFWRAKRKTLRFKIWFWIHWLILWKNSFQLEVLWFNVTFFESTNIGIFSKNYFLTKIKIAYIKNLFMEIKSKKQK